MTRGVAHKLKNTFGQAKSHNKFITGKSCQLFLNLVYGRTVPNEFPPNLLMVLLMGSKFAKLVNHGSFDLFGPSGEFGTSGPMGVAHGTQKC